MKRNATGVVVALLVGFGCSACGSGLLLNGVSSGGGSITVVRKVPSVVPALQQLPIRRSGVGTESLGTFAMHGWLYIKATCVGTGKFGVFWNTDGAYRPCLDSTRKPTVKVGSNYSVYTHRARIEVRAPAGMKWTVIIFEGPRDAGPGALNVW